MANYEEIFNLLNLPNDGTINIDDVVVNDKVKTIHLYRNRVPTFCDVCVARMYSRGIYKRNVNHQILQDLTYLDLIIHPKKMETKNVRLIKISYSLCGEKKNLDTNRDNKSISNLRSLEKVLLQEVFLNHVNRFIATITNLKDLTKQIIISKDAIQKENPNFTLDSHILFFQL